MRQKDHPVVIKTSDDKIPARLPVLLTQNRAEEAFYVIGVHMLLERSMVHFLSPMLAATLLVGCATALPPELPPAGPPPPTPEQTTQVQANILKLFPGAVVGKVAGAMHGKAAVSNIPLTTAPAGQQIKFLDANLAVIATGTVSNTTDPTSPYLVVDVTPVIGGRAPDFGDRAVYLPARNVNGVGSGP